MLLLTASTNHTGGTGLFVLAAAVGIPLYLLACVIWPYRACTKCRGYGKFRSPSGRAWRYCPKCGGRGAQIRTGRRIWAYLKGTRDRDRRTR